VKGMNSPISIFVLTFNEEKNIRRCLESVSDFSDDINVVDSYSTDATLSICESFGCHIYQNPFVNHAIQCNWALDNIPFKYEWIMRLDSDEIVPTQLKSELGEMVADASDEFTGIFLNRRMYFMNRWLKHGGIYPHHILRVFRRGVGRYEEKTEEHFVLSKGEVMWARNDFLEDNRANNLKYWLQKHDDLSDGEIRDTLQETRDDAADMKPRLFGVKVERTRWLKTNVYCRCPLFLRAGLYFFYRYIFRRGFLDGVPGLIFHVLQGFWYRFYVDARIYETQSGWELKEDDYDRI